MDQRLSLPTFLKVYTDCQRKLFHRVFSRAIDKTAMDDLESTLKILRMYLQDEDIPPFMVFAFRWAKSKGMRPGHRILRSPKLVSGFLRQSTKTCSRGFVGLDELRQAAVSTVQQKPLMEEVQRFVTSVSGVYRKGEGEDGLALAFSVVLDQNSYTHRDRIEQLCRGFFSGDDKAVSLLQRCGLNARPTCKV